LQKAAKHWDNQTSPALSAWGPVITAGQAIVREQVSTQTADGWRLLEHVVSRPKMNGFLRYWGWSGPV